MRPELRDVRRMTKTALVTGAAKRIGRAIALELARGGYDVAIHFHRSWVDAETLAMEIGSLGRRTALIQADLADESAVEAILPEAITRLGSVDTLVNNASIYQSDDVLDVTRPSWDRHMAINLRAPFVLTQQFARLLPDDMHGAVVNLLDQAVWNLTPHAVSYTASKGALWTLTQSLALGLAPRIRVNGIGPGPVLPNTSQSPEQFEEHWSSLPLGRRILPADVARTARFLIESPSLTGQMIAVDGGEHLAWAQAKHEASWEIRSRV
ncbi:short-chain dehydrogenase/reductase SDR [Mycobacterium triplex]|uniref:Short-chain dehydrogenase/reductase SDR n=2 Tax=Mycobacterium triplex TaxID=47839 RepID=A0A024JWS5_9MYCO|nr:short-chain dehydrogenase/reductase SDR [Mycobacterium triplex]